MIDLVDKFELDGFVAIDHIVNEADLLVLAEKCDSEISAEVGTRNLLAFEWARELAQTLTQHELLKPLMPENVVAVQCNYFSKSMSKNWSVALHRDLSIPVKKQITSQQWSGWSRKEGVLYAQPPKQVLAEMLAIRLHLEDNNSENGALELVAGSHKNFNPKGCRCSCPVTRGGVLVMRPLILHSSTKLKTGKRRVLHFIFGPEKLPDNAEWANAL